MGPVRTSARLLVLPALRDVSWNLVSAQTHFNSMDTRVERIKLIGFYVVLVAVFLYLCNEYMGFTFDDSFVAYRYAENLIDHGALTWNVGQEPVEGFTSLLWVVLNAGALLVGVSPLAFSKGISILSVLLMLAFLVWKGANRPWYLQLGLPAALAMSPAVAVLTVQGMETMVAGLLVLAVSVGSVWVLRAPGPQVYALWYGLVFVASLARPETLLFSAGVFVTLGVLLFRRNLSAFGFFLLWGLPLLALGGGYVGWRLWYFGHLLPSPVYAALDSVGAGMSYMANFVVSVLVPYLVLGAISFATADRDRGGEVLPTMVGIGLFGIYLLNVDPIQGFLWRYAMPLLPALLYISLHLPAPFPLTQRKGQVAAVVLVGILVGWPVHTYSDAQHETTSRSSQTRIAAGKALDGVEGRLFTADSGALAYYSEWSVIERIGLNSEDIVYGDVSRSKTLRTFEPDLVGLPVQGDQISFSEAPWALAFPYIEQEPYVAVAATKSTASRKQVYFLRATSPVCRKTVGHLKQLRALPHVPVDQVLPEAGSVPVADVLATAQAGNVCRQ